ncbi:glycosyltransferase [Pelagibacteraceae bacterium]|nr:glycosyltransferase [Pelagibacteraceae bacterium]
MKKKLFISIIIPYFKKKFFFEKTIKSINNQSYKNFEIILIYDDLNQNELLFVKKVLRKVKNKKILINEKNLGPGYSRNRGILTAKGDYVAFCDADDVWKKNKLLNQLNFMKKNKLSFSHTSYSIIDRYSKIIGEFRIKKKLDYQSLLKSCDIGLSTVMISKKILLKNKFCSLKTKEDYELWLRLSKKKLLRGLDKKFTSWRITENSLSSSLIQKLLDSFRLYYYYEKYNIFISLFYVIRLTSFAFLKKIKIYL